MEEIFEMNLFPWEPLPYKISPSAMPLEIFSPRQGLSKFLSWSASQFFSLFPPPPRSLMIVPLYRMLKDSNALFLCFLDILPPHVAKISDYNPCIRNYQNNPTIVSLVMCIIGRRNIQNGSKAVHGIFEK